MVAVCDILGFKTILKSKKLKEIVEDNYAYLRKALYSSIYQDFTLRPTPTLADFQAQNRVGFAWFSDTILLYSLEDNSDGYGNIVETSMWLLMQTILVEKARLRVGISYGDVYIDAQNQIYLGNAIAEADELQKRQEWGGGALTKKAEIKIPADIKAANFPAPWYLVQYEVPLKPLKELLQVELKYGNENPQAPDFSVIIREPMLAIDWTRFWHPYLDIHWSKTHREPDYDKEPKGHILKWKNTREFHKKVCLSCKKNSI